MIEQQLVPETDKQAIKTLEEYDDIYRSLAVSQFKLSRQQNKTIKDSLSDAKEKVFEASNKVIQRYLAM